MIKPSHNSIILYRYFCGKFLEHADICSNQISYKKVRCILGFYNLPKILRQILISEMIEYKYLERINKKEGLKIIGKSINIDNNIVTEHF